ncbi:MAG TPA: PaaX family transcriptional regulator C-terminal domain-containing protein [Actinomycetes bacterium]
MNARSALFDLYGDHLRSRGGRAPVAGLVRLLAPLGIAAPAVRTAVSRMVRQGWLEPVRLAEGPGYALTPRAVRRLDDAAARIYRTQDAAWDGSWRLVVTTPAAERSRRDRLRAGLGFLGYAQLDGTTWIGPRPSEEVDALLEAEAVRAERFTARHDGDTLGLVRRAWDLEGLARSYARWLDDAQAIAAEAAASASDEQAFAARSRLVHEWRKFLFRDPGLPHELLPDDWPGEKAAGFFDSESRRLLPAASRFVDHCLTSA